MQNPGSVVVTGSSKLAAPRPYQIVEVQPNNRSRDLTLANAMRFNLRYSVASARLSRHRKFDIVHHVLPFAISNTFNLAWLLKRTSGSKLVLGPIQQPLALQESRASSSNGTFIARPLRQLAAALSRKTVKRADAIVAISDEAKRQLLSQGASPDKVQVISPGVDLNRFIFSAQSEKNPERMELLAVGHLSTRKRVDLAIMILANILRTHRNVTLTVVGEGSEKVGLQRLAREIGVSAHVDFVGQIANSAIKRYYQRAHVLISMSQSESFGAVCLEAMASGVVVVGSRVGVFASAIREGINGYAVEPGDYQTAARRIGQLIENSSLLRRMSIEGRRECEQRFDWRTVIIPKYLRLYRDLCAEKAR